MYKNIEGCRACGATDLVDILAFGDMPLANSLLSEPQLRVKEPHFPLTVVFCPACSLVQLRETVAAEILFPDDYPYFSSVSDAWVSHCRDNALELIETRQLGQSSLVLEIASNDGYLLKNYKERGIPVLGVDPAAGVAEVARKIGIPTRVEFFGRSVAEALAAEGVRADVIHANNVLAHIADLRGVVDGLRILLNDTGVAVIEVPYLRDFIDHCEFDTIYHEHMCYFSVTAASRLFARQGLMLTDVRRLPTHGGSLRMFVQRSGPPSGAVRRLLAEEEAIGVGSESYYQDFAPESDPFRPRSSACWNRSRRMASGSPATPCRQRAQSSSILRASTAASSTTSWIAARTNRASSCPESICPSITRRRFSRRRFPTTSPARLELEGRNHAPAAAIPGAGRSVHRADPVPADRLPDHGGGGAGMTGSDVRNGSDASACIRSLRGPGPAESSISIPDSGSRQAED